MHMYEVAGLLYIEAPVMLGDDLRLTWQQSLQVFDHEMGWRGQEVRVRICDRSEKLSGRSVGVRPIGQNVHYVCKIFRLKRFTRVVCHR